MNQNSSQPAGIAKADPKWDTHANLFDANRPASAGTPPKSSNYHTPLKDVAPQGPKTKHPKAASDPQVLAAHPAPNARTSNPPVFGGVGQHATHTNASSIRPQGVKQGHPVVGKGPALTKITPDSTPQTQVPGLSKSVGANRLSRNGANSRGAMGNV